MTLINDHLRDNGLNGVLGTREVWLCSGSETLTYATLLAAKRGHVAAVLTGPAARSPTGRKVTVSAVIDGTVDAGGTATVQALVDVGNTRVLAVRPLAASFALTVGVPFTLTSWDIGIP